MVKKKSDLAAMRYEALIPIPDRWGRETEQAAEVQFSAYPEQKTMTIHSVTDLNGNTVDDLAPLQLKLIRMECYEYAIQKLITQSAVDA
ncbi:MAG: hypothetical protein V7731_01775 [Amphritea sp.]